MASSSSSSSSDAELAARRAQLMALPELPMNEFQNRVRTRVASLPQYERMKAEYLLQYPDATPAEYERTLCLYILMYDYEQQQAQRQSLLESKPNIGGKVEAEAEVIEQHSMHEPKREHKHPSDQSSKTSSKKDSKQDVKQESKQIAPPKQLSLQQPTRQLKQHIITIDREKPNMVYGALKQLDNDPHFPSDQNSLETQRAEKRRAGNAVEVETQSLAVKQRQQLPLKQQSKHLSVEHTEQETSCQPKQPSYQIPKPNFKQSPQLPSHQQGQSQPRRCFYNPTVKHKPEQPSFRHDHFTQNFSVLTLPHPRWNPDIIRARAEAAANAAFLKNSREAATATAAVHSVNTFNAQAETNCNLAEKENEQHQHQQPRHKHDTPSLPPRCCTKTCHLVHHQIREHVPEPLTHNTYPQLNKQQHRQEQDQAYLDDESAKPSHLSNPAPRIGYPSLWDGYPSDHDHDHCEELFPAVFRGALVARLEACSAWESKNGNVRY